MSNSTVTVLFGINSTSNTISECYFNCFRVLLTPNSTNYSCCYPSLIVGQLLKKSFAIVATLYRPTMRWDQDLLSIGMIKDGS